jgi:hypothetical protein
MRARNEAVKGPRWIADEESGCWIWQWGDNGQGYPSPGVRRGIYEQARGSYPKGRGWNLHHHCAAVRCVNPDHADAMPKARHDALHKLLRAHDYKGLPVAERIVLGRRLLAEVPEEAAIA